MIELIENGMELSKVREILNEVIAKVNQDQMPQVSYKDLADRPCINGVELTANTTAKELNLTLSQFGNANEIKELVREVGERHTAETVRTALESKLDSDFSALPNLRYNFNEEMLLTISDGRTPFKATINDLILYLKYLILKDGTFEKIASNKLQETDSKDPEINTPIRP